jgi:hypothetical protein
MLLFYLCILLNIKRAASSSRELKLLKRRHIVSSNHTAGIKLRSVNPVGCPAVNPDALGCEGAQSAVTSKVSAAASGETVTGAQLEDLVNAYLASCKASQCQAGCASSLTDDWIDIGDSDIAGFGAAFTQNCPFPGDATTNSVDCTSPSPDQTTCTTLYDDVLEEVRKQDWNGPTIKAAINSFTANCLTASCQNGCPDIVSSVNVGSQFSSFVNGFSGSCRPVQVVVETTQSNQQTKADETNADETSNNEANANETADESTDGSPDGKKADNFGFLRMKPSLLSIFILIGSSLLYSLFGW